MAKISEAEGEKRRKFAEAEWRKNPKLSIPKMNDRIYEKFEGRLNGQHLYALRAEVRRDIGWTPHGAATKVSKKAAPVKASSKASVKAPPAAAARAAAREAEAHRDQSPTTPIGDEDGASRGSSATLIELHTPAEASFLKEVFDRLRSDGLCKLDIDFHGDKYAIIEKAAS